MREIASRVIRRRWVDRGLACIVIMTDSVKLVVGAIRTSSVEQKPRSSSIRDLGTRKKTTEKLIHVSRGPEKGLNVNKDLHCVVDAGCWHWYRCHWRCVAVQQRENRSTKYRRCLISSPIYSNGVKFNKAAEWHWLSHWPSNIRVAKASSHTTMFARHRLHFAPADTAREPTKFASSLHRSNRTSPNRHLAAPSTPRALF